MKSILSYWGACADRGNKPRRVFAVFVWGSDGDILFWSLSQTEALRWIAKRQTHPVTLDIASLSYGTS